MKIRTRRPNLRPCGLARAVVRNVVRAVDFPLGLTPIPAALSLMCSESRRRFGDQIADTIVVQVGSDGIDVWDRAIRAAQVASQPLGDARQGGSNVDERA